MVKAFTVLKARELRGEHCASAGDVVYDCIGYDYGCASDDTRILGVKHVSVTLSPEGDYPFFTIPLDDLAPLTTTKEAGDAQG